MYISFIFLNVLTIVYIIHFLYILLLLLLLLLLFIIFFVTNIIVMKKILIIDKPELLTTDNVKGYAEIYPLFTTDITEFEGIPIIDIPEITNSTLVNGEKFKELISEINRRHSFEYEVLTEDKEQYAVKNYVCSFVGGEA